MNLSKESKSGEYKGSYTVEAALLMGIILLVMASLIIAGFYLHDRAVLQAMTCEIASAGSHVATEKEQQKVIADLRKILTRNRLMGSRNASEQTKSDKNEVSAVWQAEYPVPGMAAKFFIKNKLHIKVSWQMKRVKAAGLIRKVRGVRKLVNGGSN